jgi:Zn-dependent protease
MIEIPGRIPIFIHPFFWVTAGLIGWLNSGTMIGLFVWLGIIFVSVLFHEFGHAIAAVGFRQKTNIQLVAFGGVTSYDGPKLKFWQQFLIVFNGPFFGFLLFVLATFLLRFEWSPLWTSIFKMSQMANLFWSVVNLFPVLPLDGGQLLRIALEAGFGVKGFRASLLAGAVFSTLFALGFFAIHGYLIGSLFFLFAFQSFEQWRKSKAMTVEDRDDELRRLFVQGEEALALGKRAEAERIFSILKEKTHSGVFHITAMQYLGLLKFKEGLKEESYQLLFPIIDDLSDEARCILHELAATHQNWDLVAKLSSDCFQIAPLQEVALSNARAFAYLRQPKPAGGWLQTAAASGPLDVRKILNEDPFQAIKHESDFQQFVSRIQ